jgi:Ran GTPase-activating protein (RanGAP) involved in mRNA processing and transport
MTKLVLNRNQLYRDKHAFRRLLQGLPNSLEELSLCWNGLDEQGATVLSRRLSKLEKLRSISLAGNPIGPRGIEALIEEGNLHHISVVNLSDCDVGDEGVATLGCYLQLQSASIETLHLDMNGIGDIGLIALADGLKMNPKMKTLDLFCNDFGELGIKSLMSAISSRRSNLEHLSLRANRIADKGAQNIACRLNASSLKKLNIGYNEIGDKGASCIAESLARNKILRELKMSCNSLGNKSITVFATALVANQSLEICVLDENPKVDRRGASSFVKTLQMNRTLKSLEILDRSYENHLLNDKLDFLVKANKYGRSHVGDISIPLAAWPLILENMDGPEHLHMFLRERPDIFCNMRY